MLRKILRKIPKGKAVVALAILVLSTMSAQVQVAISFAPVLQVLASLVQALALMRHGIAIN